MGSLYVLLALLSAHSFGVTAALEYRSFDAHQQETSICSKAAARHMALGKLHADLVLLDAGRAPAIPEPEQNDLLLQEEKACTTDVGAYRAKLTTETAGYCEEMCKLLNADGCAPCKNDGSDGDSEPPTGAMTWDDLLQHMEDVQAWGQDLMFELNKKHGS
mmetsp:Transcript_74988/g.139932  ORF Transcript_74988/g.139932 Transcript_74988/m.139932 type:complete len:161 (-) Transcript_74988:50-532(-)